MRHRESILEVRIMLDDIPGWGYQAEDHVRMLQRMLDEAVGHYFPTVTHVSEGTFNPVFNETSKRWEREVQS